MKATPSGVNRSVAGLPAIDLPMSRASSVIGRQSVRGPDSSAASHRQRPLDVQPPKIIDAPVTTEGE
ncbi:MAG: hypothetical protein FJW22_09825 [Acidimicrobiia bacterium]|nr:hypothetical protein [Acidimicrobiia bacterium]